MSAIYYVRNGSRLECEKLKNSQSGTLELYFEYELCGSVALGASVKKIDGKSCIFNTGGIADGIDAPKIYLERSVIEAEAFEIKNGAPRLIPKDDGYVRQLAREWELMRREISKIKETLALFDEKINGNPIF